MKKVAKFEKVTCEQFNKDYSLEEYNNIQLPTGIRCKLDDGYVLKIYPGSSLGFKFRMSLANTVGIIDADYYKALN